MNQYFCLYAAFAACSSAMVITFPSGRNGLFIWSNHLCPAWQNLQSSYDNLHWIFQNLQSSFDNLHWIFQKLHLIFNNLHPFLPFLQPAHTGPPEFSKNNWAKSVNCVLICMNTWIYVCQWMCYFKIENSIKSCFKFADSKWVPNVV